jgi:hypothetical protein
LVQSVMGQNSSNSNQRGPMWRTQRVGAMTVRLCQQATVAGERPAIRGLPCATGRETKDVR